VSVEFNMTLLLSIIALETIVIFWLMFVRKPTVEQKETGAGR
jgi:hypothetical protein